MKTLEKILNEGFHLPVLLSTQRQVERDQEFQSGLNLIDEASRWLTPVKLLYYSINHAFHFNVQLLFELTNKLFIQLQFVIL